MEGENPDTSQRMKTSQTWPKVNNATQFLLPGQHKTEGSRHRTPRLVVIWMANWQPTDARTAQLQAQEKPLIHASRNKHSTEDEC